MLRRFASVFKLSLAIVAAAIVVGCNPSRPAQMKTMDVSGAEGSQEENEISSKTAARLKKAYDLYSPTGGLKPAEIERLVHQFSPEMDSFTKAALKNGSLATYTFEEFWKQAGKTCITIEWSNTGSVMNKTDLVSTLARVYPEADVDIRLALADRIGHSNDASTVASDLIKRGMAISTGQRLIQAEGAKNFFSRFIAEKLWSLKPTLPANKLSSQDRDIALMLLAIDLAEEPLATLTAEQLGDPVRAIHQNYFAQLQLHAPKLAGLDFARFESVDWKMTEKVGKSVATQTPLFQNSHFNNSFTSLGPQWGSKQNYFTERSTDLRLDLFVAGAADDLIRTCGLVRNRTLDQDFLQIFLYRMAAGDTSSTDNSQFCARAKEAFAPTAIDYLKWRIKLALKFGASRSTSPLTASQSSAQAVPLPIPLHAQAE